MTASERIKIITSIANRMQSEDWTIIDLTLKQYSLPYSDTWNGERFAYVVKMLEDASDTTLISLYNHLGFDEEKKDSTDITPAFWDEGCFRLFVSHLVEHKDDAIYLKNNMLRYGISCFVAHRDIEPSREWLNEIELGLKTCDSLVALLRPGFHASKWTDQEIGYAMGRDLLVTSVRLGEDPYGFIGRYQAVQSAQWPDIVQQLIDVHISSKKTKKNISRAALHVLSRSNTFAEAKENMGLIEKLTYWDSENEKRILEILEENGQVKESWGVENRIIAFNAKWKGKSV